MINEKEIIMTPEEIKAAVAATRARVLKVSTEDKIRMNCSHRSPNGNLTVKSKVIKVTNGNGGFVDKRVLQCTTCGSIIEQVSEAEYRQIMESLPAVVNKVINYVKTFDKKWTEEEREFTVMTQFCILNLLMIFESTIVEARKNKNRDNQGQQKRMVTSGNLFNSRY